MWREDGCVAPPLGFGSGSPQARRSPGAVTPSWAATLPWHKLVPLQNHSNTDIVSIDCNVKLAPNEEMNLHLRGNLWMKSLKAVSPPSTGTWLLGNPPKVPPTPQNAAKFFFPLSCNCLPLAWKGAQALEG